MMTSTCMGKQVEAAAAAAAVSLLTGCKGHRKAAVFKI
jgi:hypothetical protein